MNILLNHYDFGGGFTVDPNEYAGVNASGIPVYYDTTSGKYYDYNGREVATSGTD